MAIVRPSIVGGSAREPVPGWVDVISAAGAVYLSVGLGVLKFLPGSEHNMADVVPVDYVTNVILGAIPAIRHQNRYLIFHAATSSEKPMSHHHLTPLHTQLHTGLLSSATAHPPLSAVLLRCVGTGATRARWW